MPEEQPGCTIPPCPSPPTYAPTNPSNQQEASDREVILRQLEADPRVFQRDSLAHMTCSIWTVDPTATKTLMVFHNTYGSWSWIGGHADGERDLERVALRRWRRRPASPTRASCRAGRGTSSRSGCSPWTGTRNAGATSLACTPQRDVSGRPRVAHDDPLRVKPIENSGVRWMDFDEALAASAEPWMRDRIYRKLRRQAGRGRPRNETLTPSLRLIPKLAGKIVRFEVLHGPSGGCFSAVDGALVDRSPPSRSRGANDR